MTLFGDKDLEIAQEILKRVKKDAFAKAYSDGSTPCVGCTLNTVGLDFGLLSLEFRTDLEYLLETGDTHRMTEKAGYDVAAELLAFASLLMSEAEGQ